MQPAEVSESFAAAFAAVERLRVNVESVVRGKTEQIRLVLAALACQGHVLFEDVPGTAKTVLARSLAGSIEGAIPARIQCTPDLQPTDVTGLSVWSPEDRRFDLPARPGVRQRRSSSTRSTGRCRKHSPRCSRRWRSARSRSTASRTPLPHPFLLLATENSIEQEGTFPLPEAQLDRFVIRTSLGYPTLDEEIEIVDAQLHGHPLGRPATGARGRGARGRVRVGRGRVRRPVAQALGGRARPRDADAGHRRGRRLGAREPRARARRRGRGRSCTAATT